MQQNTISCNTAISEDGKGRDWQLILGLRTAIAESIMQQNIISCNAVISNGDTGRDWHLFIGFLAEMVDTVTMSRWAADPGPSGQDG